MNISTKRVNGAVAIKLRLEKHGLEHMNPKIRSLRLDLNKLLLSMTPEEFNEYQRRIQ